MQGDPRGSGLQGVSGGSSHQSAERRRRQEDAGGASGDRLGILCFQLTHYFN